MTGGKITLLIFNCLFAAILVVLLWMNTAKSVEFQRKRAAIQANQEILAGMFHDYQFLKDSVVGLPGDPLDRKSKEGIPSFRYQANDYGPAGEDDALIPAEEQKYITGEALGTPDWKRDDQKKLVPEPGPVLRRPHLLHSQDSIEKQRAGEEQSGNAKDEKVRFKTELAEADKKKEEFKASLIGVKPAWEKIKDTEEKASKDMRSLMVDWGENQNKFLSSEANLRNEIYRKKTSLVKTKIDHQKQQATWARQGNQLSEDIDSIVNRTLNKALKETRSNELQPDGRVLDAAVADFEMVTIDIGRRNGVRENLIFTVYDVYAGQNDVKGEIQVAEVRETTAICKVLHRPKEVYISDRTQWKTNDNRVQYDPLGSRKVAGVAETRPEPMRPHSPASERQDVLDSLIPPKTAAFQQDPQATGTLRPEYDTPSTNPIQRGDLIASAEFQPVISQREASNRFIGEMTELRDVSLERLNFSIMPDFSDNEVAFLSRSIKTNSCVLHQQVEPRTNFLIVREPLSEYVATNADRLRFLIDINTKSARGLAPDSKVALLAKKRGDALDTAQRYNTRIMTLDEANTFFQARRRKADLLSGHLELGGRSMFYVAGQSATRSRSQIESFIRENQGLVTEELTDEVDWLVAGAGSDKEIDQAKKLGVRILREKDVELFFAHTSTVTGGN